ncbi:MULTISPECIES: exonuclease family protein [Enterobacteriaceae]|uniref:exodeoxyribonuclease VIII n=1 Tax=Enterobacteriaceae TaxID=543 RepID=UPI0015E9009F|nr:exodeoxyribonuclease VIII [Citrobacter freundii]MBJ8803334.1 exodeoxyribonuclease VIII [Citrobacter freundii]QLU36040.1 exodeoxyribonuclease VIII [Enterobacter cloacae]HBV0976723.1 exodeoxyribonuclease VIII [Citrobacter freundii]HEI9736732.1 exodeoxyribonuclease VIII [Citrobacter freundii]
MSVELKVFGGAYFPKDKALKKHPDLKPLATAVNSATKAIAEAVIFGKLAAEHPEHIDDYFKVKIWEHREGLPCPELDVFSPEFFDTVAIWNVNAGEPAAAPQPESEEKTEWDDNEAVEEIKTVSRLDQASRAACLALFGPVPGITTAQYGQIVDLINDDASSFTRELADALAKETRALALDPERQEQLLAWVRENTKDSAQWPDIKKQIAKWIDTPVDKRPQAASTDNKVADVVRTDSDARLCTGTPTDRNFKHSKDSLGNEIALGLLAREHEFNIYTVDMPLYQQAEKIRLSGTDEEFNAWYRMFISTPGGLDFSRAINIAVVKTAPADLWKAPVKHREYFNRVMTESDHSKPDPLIVDIACGSSSSPMPQTIKENVTHDETKSSVPGETLPPTVCPGEAAQLDKELNEAFAQSPAAEKQVGDQPRVENLGGGVFSVDALLNTAPSNEGEKQEVPPALSDREIEIAHALNELMSGRTNIVDKDDVEYLIATTGKDIGHLFPLLIADITATEFCLSPDFSDEEVQDVATTILEKWSDDISVRQKIALDAIVEYRRPEPPKSVVLDPPAVSAKPKTEPEPAPETNAPLSSVTYLQQLTIAALQGLCSNPAYCNQYDELPAMAAGLALSVVSQQEVAE